MKQDAEDVVGSVAFHGRRARMHGHDHRPLHGGIIAETADDLNVELVAKSDGLGFHVTQHGKPLRAKIFSQVGKKTDLFARFTTVAGERGAAGAERDIVASEAIVVRYSLPTRSRKRPERCRALTDTQDLSPAGTWTIEPSFMRRVRTQGSPVARRGISAAAE